MIYFVSTIALNNFSLFYCKWRVLVTFTFYSICIHLSDKFLIDSWNWGRYCCTIVIDIRYNITVDFCMHFGSFYMHYCSFLLLYLLEWLTTFAPTIFVCISAGDNFSITCCNWQLKILKPFIVTFLINNICMDYCTHYN